MECCSWSDVQILDHVEQRVKNLEKMKIPPFKLSVPEGQSAEYFNFFRELINKNIDQSIKLSKASREDSSNLGVNKNLIQQQDFFSDENLEAEWNLWNSSRNTILPVSRIGNRTSST